MKFLARFSILALCLLIAILIAIPFTLDNSSLKFQIEQKISQKLNNNFEIKGEVEVAFLPSPRIIINEAYLNNYPHNDNFINLKIKQLTAKLEVIPLLRRKINVNSVIFDSPQMEIHHMEQTIDSNNDKNPQPIISQSKPAPPTKAKLSDKIFAVKNLKDGALNFKNIKNIQVISGSLNKFDDEDKRSLEFTKINFDAKNKIQNFTARGDFSSQEIPTEFKIIIDTNKDNSSTLVISSPILKLELTGKFNDTKINNLAKANFNGRFNAEIINLKSLLGNYFSKNNLLYGRINNTKPIKISSDIKGQEGEIIADNIVINSQLVSGQGEIEANFSLPRPVIDIDVDINNIDIDSLFLTSFTKDNEKIIKFQNGIIGKFLNSQSSRNPEKTQLVNDDTDDDQDSKNTPGDVDLTAEISIKSAKYLEGELKDISLYLIAANKHNILLQPVLMKTPGNGTIRINGVFQDENDVPKFVGRVDAGGKNFQQFLSWLKIESQNLKPGSLPDYNLMSDILLLPNFMILNNFYIRINNNKNLLIGNFKYENTTGIPNITSDFVINELNVEDYFLISDQNQYLNNGSLLQKFLWLNSNNSNTSLSLFFNKLIYKQNIFYDQMIKVAFGQGYLKLSDLQLKSDDINIRGLLNVNITNNNPIINIDLEAENFRYTTVPPSDNNLPPSKPDSDFKSGFIRQFFNLPSFDNFNGTVNLKVNNLMVDDLKINDVTISGKMKDGELALDQSEINLYGGNLKYTGNVILKSSKAFNGTFTFTNVNNNSFLADLLNIKNVSGTSNISGSVSFVGKNRDEFYKNLDLQLKFISANVLVKNFGMDDLVIKMLAPTQYMQELSNPIDIIFNDNSRSYFKEVNGTLDIARNNRDNQLRIETSAVGINSVTVGSLDLANNLFEGTSNFIFLTGTKQKHIPINVAISYKGKFDNLLKSANTDQINQYLQNVR